MKKLKRGLALLLAIVLVAVNAIYSLGSELKANEVEQQQTQIESTGETEGAGQQAFSTEGMNVEVVDPKTEEADSGSVEDVQPQENSGIIQETEQTDPSEKQLEASENTEEPEEETSENIQYKMNVKATDVNAAIVEINTGEMTELLDLEQDYGTQVEEGSSIILTVKPNEGYSIAAVMVNNTELEASETGEESAVYRIEQIVEDKVVELSFTNEKENKNVFNIVKASRAGTMQTTVKINETAPEVDEGKKITLTAAVTPEMETEPVILWSSENESVAKVDDKGVVTGIKGGEAKITAEVNGKKAAVKVKVIPTGFYTITYKLGSQFQNAYALTKGEDGKVYTTAENACKNRLTGFGVWLKTKSGTAVMPVTMTLANDVTGTDMNGNSVTYTRGTVISKLDGKNAKVVMPYSHTYFKANSNIQIEVTPAEEATYNVTYHVSDEYRGEYVLTGNGASGLDYTKYSQWCSSRFTSFGVWLKAGKSQVMPVKMTLLSDVQGTDDKGHSVSFEKGSVISELRSSNGNVGAYVSNGFNFTYFNPASDIHIEVEPALFNVHTQYYLEELDGSYILDKDVEGDVLAAGTKVTAEKETYTGFTYDPQVEGTIEEGTVTGLESLVLKLYYKRNIHEVTYEVDGHTDSKVDTYKYGETVSLRQVPEKTGYDFNGWSEKDNFTMPDENKVIYGSFVARGDTPYRVEHYREGLDGKYVLDSEDIEQKEGKTGTLAAAVPNSYEGFTYDPDAEDAVQTGVIRAEEELVLRLYYKRNSYTVSYVADGQNIGEPDTYQYGEKIGELRDAPVKTGYTFNGWNIEEFPERMPAENIEVEGSYGINSYSVTYLVDGDIYNQSVMQEYGSTVTPMPIPLKRGYSFSGWDKPFSFEMPAEDVVISGYFDVNSYNYAIQYQFDEVLDESQTVNAQADYGQVVTAEAPEAAEYNGQNYSLMEGEYELQVSDKPEENIITVQYEINEENMAAAAPASPGNQEGGGAADSETTAAREEITLASVAQTIFEPVITLAERAAEQIENTQQTIQSDDGEVPLANTQGETQRRCALHFFILLLAFIIELGYIRSRKKEQEKHFALFDV